MAVQESKNVYKKPNNPRYAVCRNLSKIMCTLIYARITIASRHL